MGEMQEHVVDLEQEKRGGTEGTRIELEERGKLLAPLQKRELIIKK